MATQDWFSWTKNPVLLSALEAAVHGQIPKDVATTLIDGVIAESPGRIVTLVGKPFYGKYFPTNRVGGRWGNKQPSGWVDHYTAGVHCDRTLRWFSSRVRGTPGSSSAHVVVDRDGAIIILVDPRKRVAWHATWANPTHIGVEHVNAGFLTKNAEDAWTYGDYGSLYPEDRHDDVVPLDKHTWEPYTTAQVVSNIVLKRAMLSLVPTLDRDKFTDHQQIDPVKKQDCGPLWPLEAANDLALSDGNFSEFESLRPTIMRLNVAGLFMTEVADLLTQAPGAPQGPI